MRDALRDFEREVTREHFRTAARTKKAAEITGYLVRSADATGTDLTDVIRAAEDADAETWSHAAEHACGRPASLATRDVVVRLLRAVAADRKRAADPFANVALT